MTTAVPPLHAAPAVTVKASTLSMTWVFGALFLGLALYYFIGVDQGATSIFGDDAHIHEWVHDARHFLGFPCH